jgi:hypothetical protein
LLLHCERPDPSIAQHCPVGHVKVEFVSCGHNHQWGGWWTADGTFDVRGFKDPDRWRLSGHDGRHHDIQMRLVRTLSVN